MIRFELDQDKIELAGFRDWSTRVDIPGSQDGLEAFRVRENVLQVNGCLSVGCDALCCLFRVRNVHV